jgi:hypothetical protein
MQDDVERNAGASLLGMEHQERVPLGHNVAAVPPKNSVRLDP